MDSRDPNAQVFDQINGPFLRHSAGGDIFFFHGFDTNNLAEDMEESVLCSEIIGHKIN